LTGNPSWSNQLSFHAFGPSYTFRPSVVSRTVLDLITILIYRYFLFFPFFFSGIEPYGIYAWIGMVKRCREMGNVASFKQQLELANGVSNFWLPGIDKLALIKSLVFYHFVYRFSPLHFFLYLGFRHFSPHHMYLLFFCFWNLQHIPLTRNGIGVAGQDGAEDMTRRGRETGIWDGDIDG